MAGYFNGADILVINEYKLKKTSKEHGKGMFGHGAFYECSFYNFREKVGSERRIPFEVSADPFYSESNIRYLERKKRDIDEGRAHLAEHDLIEVED